MTLLQEARAMRIECEKLVERTKQHCEATRQLESDTIDLLLRATEAVEWRGANELDKR